MIHISRHVWRGLIGEMIELKMNKKKIYYLGLIAILPLLASCEDNKSYSELLKEEEQAVNWFLAQQKIVPYIPADSVFDIGADAPYYKMDEDGYVYMQIVDSGNPDSRPQKGETVYFRYLRRNIKDYANGINSAWSGNAENLLGAKPMSLIYGNTVLENTTQWGEGIQVPLGYVGYDSEVNLVIQSPKGPYSLQTECIPLQYNIKYFKAEY